MKMSAIAVMIVALAFAAAADEVVPLSRPFAAQPKVFVPYQDLGEIIDPCDRAVLMDRAEFARLLAAAQANTKGIEDRNIGQITSARYTAEVEGDKVKIAGILDVVSLTEGPIPIPIAFGQIGLTSLRLDGATAPLGFDAEARLTVIVGGRGAHQLAVEGNARLSELAQGGMQFSLSVPEAVAATMLIKAAGDLEIHSTVPAGKPSYDRNADTTSVELTLGGHGALTVVLLGNGRQDDQRAILLGDSATTVSIGRTSQDLACLYSVHVLRRGLRELRLSIPAPWTVTDVACPNLVKWSIEPGPAPILAVRLRNARVGVTALSIRASAPRGGETWTAPRISLVDADFQRGRLLVGTDEQIAVRAETAADARREDASSGGDMPVLAAAASERLYHHWGNEWSIELELAAVPLRRSVEERQFIVVSSQDVRIRGEFRVTAVDREMFNMRFLLGGSSEQWQLKSLEVDGRAEGFEYRITDSNAARQLAIELPAPIKPEKMATVTIVLEHVPPQWSWPSEASPRTLSVPLIGSAAETVAGHVLVSGAAPLAATPEEAPAGLESVPVGRMAALGIPVDVEYAYSYATPAAGQIALNVARRRPRVSATSVGLISVRPEQYTGIWRVEYTISRASTRKLLLATDKALGRELSITCPTVALSSKGITPDDVNTPIEAALRDRYHVWSLVLDKETIGPVQIDVRYQRPLDAGGFTVGLVRPLCEGQITEQIAVEAVEELALDITAVAAEDIDAIDLPPLPAAANRVLAAYRLAPVTAENGARTAIDVRTTVHENYAIPSALAVAANLTTWLAVDGGQRSEAVVRVANAGRQHLVARLPQNSQLWSLEIDGRPAKPQRSSSGDYQIALTQASREATIKLVYAHQPDPGAADRGAAASAFREVHVGRLELPGVRINQTTWTVYAPPGYRIAALQSRMQTQDILRPRPAYEKLTDLVLGTLWAGCLSLDRAGSDYARVYSGQAAAEYAGDEVAVLEESAAQPQIALDHPATLDIAMRAAEAPPAAEPAPPLAQAPAQMHAARGVRLMAEGRYSLPVELVATPGTAPAVVLTSLADADLVLTLSRTSRARTAWVCGFLMVFGAGLAVLRRPASHRAALVVATLFAGSLVAIWSAAWTPAANGAFTAGACLIPLYLVAYPLRKVWRLLRAWALNPIHSSAAVVLVVAVLACSAGAAEPQGVDSPSGALIAPYRGDPTLASGAGKVLVPYCRFIELWNLAHPEDRIDGLSPGTEISLADVRYTVAVSQERLDLLLTADVRTFGRGPVVLNLPVADMAVVEADFGGQPIQVHAGLKGNLVMLDAPRTGRLTVKALARPEWLGQRGSAAFSLPPLPGALMQIHLPDDSLVPEIEGLDGILVPQTTDGQKTWTVGLGLTRRIALRWAPQAGGGAADQTLSAECVHNVYTFHWAMLGVTNIKYTFAAGQQDRFAILLPTHATLTALTGANLGDFSRVAERTIDGCPFDVIEVRLHRPARQTCELQLRWLADLPVFGRPTELQLVRADAVSRESGTVTVHAVDGMTVKIADAQGARRMDLPAPGADPTVVVEAGRPVARYYWPYRPFALRIEMDRPAVEPQVALDQLVRINKDRAELLVQASLKTERGRIFGAAFELPSGYELLSVVGPAVEKHYERSADSRRIVHVKLREGCAETQLALVLTRRDIALDDFDVPKITYIDAQALSYPPQKGRLAVQVAASLDAGATTAAGLKSITPQTLGDWLKGEQINSVQYAYRYEAPAPQLRLRIRRQPTRINVETFAGVVVRPSAVLYTYRLRYNITGSPVDRVVFRMGAEYAPLAAVESPAMRGSAQAAAADGRTEWTVSLLNEVTGLVDVVVNFLLPIEGGIAELPVPLIETGAADGYNGIVAIQNMSRHEISVKQQSNLADLPPTEQQRLMPGAMRESLQYVFQSFEENWGLVLNFKPAPAASRIQAVVDLMATTTVIDRAGRARYEVRLALQNRSEQYLAVRIPDGLALWSAAVADQPVKPVVDPNAPQGCVLIPLVKTSPGGLPYDVVLYLADESPSGLVAPLDGMTRIEPPAVAVVGIPVMQTTWSLQLPAGYRYLWPGGNMNAVAGTVEMMSLRIDAELEQLKRLEKAYREVLGSRTTREQVTRQNWYSFNTRVEQSIAQTRQFLESNRGRVDERAYGRLHSKLGSQFEAQQQLYGGNMDYVEKQNVQAGSDINYFLNTSVSNTGVAESIRDSALENLPEFVVSNEARQVERLEQELAKSLETAQKYAAGKPAATPVAPQTPAPQVRWEMSDHKAADDLLADRDKDADVRLVLGDISRDAVEGLSRKQAQLQSQLEELQDNRLQRRFRTSSGSAQVEAKSRPQEMAQTADEVAGGLRQHVDAGLDLSGVAAGGGMGGMGGYGGGAYAGQGRPDGRLGGFGFGVSGQPQDTPVAGRVAVQQPQPARPQGPSAVTDLGEGAYDTYYAASGTYSLPVGLPQGQIRLDFARAGGEPRLRVYAVPAAVLDSLLATAVLLAVLVVVLAVARLWPRPTQKRPLRPLALLLYVVAFIGLTFGLGLVGAAVAVLTIAAAEARRGAFLPAGV